MINMKATEFCKVFLPILKNKVKTKEYSEKSYSRRYGNISAHKDEFNPEVFNYIAIDDDIFHIAYPYEVELTKEGKNGMYGIIKGSWLKAVDLEYLKPFMDFQELETVVQKSESEYVWENTIDPYTKASAAALLNQALPVTSLPINEFQAIYKHRPVQDASVVSNEIQQFFTALTDKFAAKSKEYATDSWDSNFVKGGRVLGVSKEQALLGYATKHLVSIMDIVEGKSATKEEIDEKFGDLIVYFSLLRVMLLEKVK